MIVKEDGRSTVDLRGTEVHFKWHIKFENVAEIQRQWKREFQTQPPTRLTITRLCDKFDTHGKVYNVTTKVCYTMCT